VSDLEYLLALDTEAEAILVRTTSQPPEPHEVATLYNQWAFEAALFNASNVRFVIDCRAFAQASSETSEAAPVSTGVGAVIKRLCYLARKIGVYYDLAYDTTVVTTSPLLTLTLYGPQEVTGAAQQYGMRLARLCRLLLYTTPADAGRSKKSAKAALSNSIVEASATVHFLQRTYTFIMSANILHAIETPQRHEDSSSEKPYEGRPTERAEESSSIYDSSIEQSFSEAFSALAHSRGVDGWRLEREPEPLLLPNSIFIADFALTRANRRIYVEILGFWTPSYRERKIQKLHYLQGRNDLLLAIPVEAKEAFTSIAALFPIVYYDGQLSATEVIHMLRSHYDDFAERLARLDVPAVQEHVMDEHMLPERTCYELLYCYRRSELQTAIEHIINQQIAFAPGFGLYERAWMLQLQQSFITWITPKTVCSLTEVLQELRTCWPLLVQCEDAALEALLATWQEVEVQRSSIFEAQVALVGAQFIAPTPPALDEKQEKRQVRERRTVFKKRTDAEAIQTDLWG
jgi:predicted nuclease of restriction endonuclease-like RecB superfamily